MTAKLSLLTLGLALAAQAGAAQNCVAPEPVLSLSYESRYKGSDAARATINEETKTEAEDSLRPLDDFIRDLANGLEAMLKLPADQRAAPADCLIAQMAQWARADALSDQASETVRLTIGARLAAFGIIAGRAAEFATGEAGLDQVRAWLSRRMFEQMRFWEEAPSGAASGNLRAWAGLAGAGIAALSDDAVIRGWSAWSISYVLCAANPDGSLPQEMSRGKYALHYQLHALAPLVTAVLMLDRQGVALGDHCGGALRRAVGFALSDLTDGQQTLAITGQVQTFFDGTDTLDDFQLAWLEPYLQLTADPLAEIWAAPRRPLSFSKLGGNQTLLWAP